MTITNVLQISVETAKYSFACRTRRKSERSPCRFAFIRNWFKRTIPFTFSSLQYTDQQQQKQGIFSLAQYDHYVSRNPKQTLPPAPASQRPKSMDTIMALCKRTALSSKPASRRHQAASGTPVPSFSRRTSRHVINTSRAGNAKAPTSASRRKPASSNIPKSGKLVGVLNGTKDTKRPLSLRPI